MRECLQWEEIWRNFALDLRITHKLELVIFNNCLSGNYQFANVMSKYADYMFGSEEVMYVGAVIDRLNFLNDVKESDNGLIPIGIDNSSDSTDLKKKLSKVPVL